MTSQPVGAHSGTWKPRGQGRGGEGAVTTCARSPLIPFTLAALQGWGRGAPHTGLEVAGLRGDGHRPTDRSLLSWGNFSLAREGRPHFFTLSLGIIFKTSQLVGTFYCLRVPGFQGGAEVLFLALPPRSVFKYRCTSFTVLWK